MSTGLFSILFKFAFVLALLFSAVPFFFLFGCRSQPPKNEPMGKFPTIILWAWERPENLEFIDPKQYGVAYLAQTLELNADEVTIRPRRQPLQIPSETKVIAVTRIETNKASLPSLSDGQKEKIISAVLKTLDAENVRALQIDFDATVSERDFYRSILHGLRTVLPRDFAISITALASFCIGDGWIRDLPVDEAVPMIFRMGADEKNVREFLANGNDFSVPLCRTSYGIATDEPLKIDYQSERRVYVFNAKPWRSVDLKLLPEAVRR